MAKNNSVIKFPFVNFDLKQYLSKELKEAPKETRYDLYAIIVIYRLLHHA